MAVINNQTNFSKTFDDLAQNFEHYWKHDVQYKAVEIASEAITLCFSSLISLRLEIQSCSHQSLSLKTKIFSQSIEDKNLVHRFNDLTDAADVLIEKTQQTFQTVLSSLENLLAKNREELQLVRADYQNLIEVSRVEQLVAQFVNSLKKQINLFSGNNVFVELLGEKLTSLMDLLNSPLSLPVHFFQKVLMQLKKMQEIVKDRIKNSMDGEGDPEFAMKKGILDGLTQGCETILNKVSAHHLSYFINVLKKQINVLSDDMMLMDWKVNLSCISLLLENVSFLPSAEILLQVNVELKIIQASIEATLKDSPLRDNLEFLSRKELLQGLSLGCEMTLDLFRNC